MKTSYKKINGFTLLEILLVMAIMGTILLLIINYSSQRMDQYRRDRAALQMQQILNAGLAYYVQNGQWPVATCGTPVALDTNPPTSLLQTNGSFLPNQQLFSPWPVSGSYRIDCDGSSGTGGNATGNFLVSVITPTVADAQVLAGQLPMAQVDTNTRVVTARVPVPGQNLNNARSINYAGVYNSGACVPVPTCPVNMTAQIFTAPQSVAGVYDPPLASDGSACTTGTSCASVKANPITSYQAYAVGGATSTPGNCSTGAAQPCYLTADPTSAFSPAGGVSSGSYWRVCLKVGSESGDVNPQITAAYPTATNAGTGSVGLYWTQAMGQIIAFTRCVPSGGEPTGSNINIWSP